MTRTMMSTYRKALRTGVGGSGKRSGRWAALAAVMVLSVSAQAQTPLEIYDAAIAADAGVLPPVATLTAAVVLDGTKGSAFDFGSATGDATLEFIIEGNPSANNSAYLAVGATTASSLRFEVWDNTGELGFTQAGVADYRFTPGVPSTTKAAHLAYVWDPAAQVMKVYVNGALAGSASGVSPVFVMPSGSGWLGANENGEERMVGTIHRVTVYDSVVPESTIKRHASAFGAQVSQALAAYDGAIAADVGTGLTPAARQASTVVLNGTGGVDFDFGAGADDVTMEFILEGDPAANVSAYLAVGENSSSSLRYELWDNTGQLGFTQIGVADYGFSPGVASPALPTHVTYAWNASELSMKVYINGVLAGSAANINAAFAMPSGPGRLGANPTGVEPMFGTIYRVTVYDDRLDDAVILRHAKAFADLLSPPSIVSFTVAPSVVAPGESATLNWEVQNATRVLVNGVDRTGTTSLVVSGQISSSYTLSAENALGKVTQVVRLQVTPELGAYDAAIAADANAGLTPLARLTSPIVAGGTGVPFDFGATAGDATIEFILEGDPAAGAGTAIATDYDESGIWRHSLRYSQWAAAGQLGFTKRAVADYVFTPLVPASSWPTHVAFVWDSTALTLSVYVNGFLAGANAAVDPNFALPKGRGTLGDGMVGTIFRVTVYAGILPEARILSHSRAFLDAARPALSDYDEAIAASAASGLTPAARLWAPVTLTGIGGAPFHFGVSSDDATIEFIMEGDPKANNTAYLAVGENATSSLRYELWDNTGQLGFTQSAVADYSFTPGVPSPTAATHVAYAWDMTAATMRLYLDGVLAGTTTGVDVNFAMPTGVGRLGNNASGTEPMVGTVHRVTVYDSLLANDVILRHARAFSSVSQPPVLGLDIHGALPAVTLGQGVPGMHYRVEYRNSLSAADAWQLLADIPSLIGTSVRVEDSVPWSTRSERFYRAVLIR